MNGHELIAKLLDMTAEELYLPVLISDCQREEKLKKVLLILSDKTSSNKIVLST